MKYTIFIFLFLIFFSCTTEDNIVNPGDRCKDVNCNDWESCDTRNGVCFPKDGRCNIDTDCGLREICKDDHYCAYPTACDGVECDYWKECISGTCILKDGYCETDNHCSNEQFCDDQHLCSTDSCYGIDCEDWEICISGGCYLKDDRCEDDQGCENGKLCSSSHFCVDDPCAVIECSDIEECSSELGTCILIDGNCYSDIDCPDNYFCVENRCAQKKDDGIFCIDSFECSSDHCQNGFCCGEGDCCITSSDCPENYNYDSTCDNTRTCQGYRGEAVCLENICSTYQFEDDSGCGLDVISDSCGPYSSVYCNGERVQNMPQCLENCENDQSCDEGSFCDGGICSFKKPDGYECEDSFECSSNHCQNGLCCEEGDCCTQFTDCPDSYFKESVCYDPINCQGRKEEPSCIGYVCKSKFVEDDTSCDNTILSSSCGNFPSVYCSGDEVQFMPDCANACFSTEDCEEGFICNSSHKCTSSDPCFDPYISCQNDMVGAGSVCIDRYEVARGDATSTYGGNSSFPTSQWGVIPWMVQYDQNILETVENICLSADKRLCSEEEWVSACQGPEGENNYSYGDLFNRSYCNNLDTFCSIDNQEENCGVEAGNNHFTVTGAFPYCANDYGAYDLSGNLVEIVTSSTDPRGYKLKGGGYNIENPSEVLRCIGDYRGDDLEYIGFRCCKDREVRPECE